MIEDIVAFIRKGVIPNYRMILFSENLYISFAITVFFIYQPMKDLFQPYKIGSVVEFASQYNLVTLGFLITALTLVIGIPSREFISFLSEKRDNGRVPYKDLVFVFSWTIFVHLIAFLICLIISTTFSEEFSFIYGGAIDGAMLFSWGYIFIQIYSGIQLLSVIFATIFVASLYAQHLAKLENS